MGHKPRYLKKNRVINKQHEETDNHYSLHICSNDNGYSCHFAVQPAMSNHVCASDAIKKDNRPVESKRLFCSKAVEEQIQRIQQLLKIRSCHGCSLTAFPTRWTPPSISARTRKTGSPTHLSTPEISMPCGSATQVRRCGPTYSWPMKTRN